MHHFIAPLFLVSAEDQANEADRQLDNIEALANKQRRKVQNRKNQRLHRLRKKGPNAASAQTSRPFQVERWRLDEVDGLVIDAGDSITKDAKNVTSIAICASTVGLRQSPPRVSTLAPTTLNPPPMVFPLSTDHLLHLVQYNVFRAFVSNKQALNVLLKAFPTPTTPTSTL
ncbi:hypothetical protein ACET3X_006349 [Alternaria dauci]|uniref:Uncharacterized protein n=1 Tax=Alternaria dauci TaxID=48095 RepID=A0ABR3UI17_9PLEO